MEKITNVVILLIEVNGVEVVLRNFHRSHYRSSPL
jgi:hypothetical protein